MNASDVNSIIRENKARRKALFAPYDPVTGVGSPIERERIEFSVGGNEFVWGIPVTMYNENAALIDAIARDHKLESVLHAHGIPADNTGIELFLRDLINQRFRYDYEFWSVTAARIQDKRTKQIVPFTLNQPQRKVLAVLERMRIAGIPIRIIIDKARQWGGSTLVQIYMAWIQLIHRTRWHSCIVTDVEEQARNIRAMYSRLITNYPKDLGGFELSPLEGSNKNRRIDERDCSIIIGSSQKPDSLRTFDLAMAHLSEVSFWKTTELRSAEDLAQSVRAGVAQVPFSLIALESTAKGVGNFFHREWLTAVDGKSAYAPVFVPWFEIELYQKDIPEADLSAFVKWMDAEPYASYLWSLGATLEGIKWYFDFKNGENYDEWRMKSEFPSTWEESFQATGARVFSPAYVNQARKHKMEPEFVGDIRGKTIRDKTALEDIELIQADRGNLFIWMYPDKEEQVSNRYVVSMDIGGRSPGADYTVMRVFDRYGIMDGGVPETVATWKGHCFVPGTQIYTSMGFKNIEDIGIGDEVWTHKNRFRKVLRKYKRPYNGEVISLKSQGNYETVTCTPEHPFYSNETLPITRRNPRNHPGRYTYYTRDVLGSPSWIRASDLKYFAYSREREAHTHPPFIINKYNGGKSKHTLREITDLKTFFSVLGYYLAEGHINRRSKDRNQFQSICFSFSYHERDTVAKDCYEKLLSLGFKCSIIEYKSVSVCRVRAYDTFLTKLVLDLCGEHSWEKRLSPVIFDYPIELLSILLDSYWKGDGSVYKTDQSVSNIITTVSPVLARQIRDILILLGHRPGTYRVVAKTKSKGIKKVRPRYNVVWSASEIKKNVLLQNEDHVVYKVKSRERCQYSGLVFNLEVEDDNSYSTACYIVHNCDQDLGAWKAVQLAKFYNNALFIPESNSYDKTSMEAEGDHFLTILDEIVKYYPNIFARTDPEKIRQGIPVKYGFHTNPVSKPMIIDFLNAALRDELFYERDDRVFSELDTYEIKPNGRYGAVDGCHDDMVMATAIGLWACLKHLPPPRIILPTVKRRPGRITEATI